MIGLGQCLLHLGVIEEWNHTYCKASKARNIYPQLVIFSSKLKGSPSRIKSVFSSEQVFWNKVLKLVLKLVQPGHCVPLSAFVPL